MTDLRTKIAELIAEYEINSSTDFRTPLDAADAILSLPELREALERKKAMPPIWED